jgi:hypothetical protein
VKVKLLVLCVLIPETQDTPFFTLVRTQKCSRRLKVESDSSSARSKPMELQK